MEIVDTWPFVEIVDKLGDLTANCSLYQIPPSMNRLFI